MFVGLLKDFLEFCGDELPEMNVALRTSMWREIERFVTKIRPLIPNLQDGLRNVFVTFPSTDNGTPSPIISSGINKALQRVWGEKLTATRLRKATATNVSHEAHLN